MRFPTQTLGEVGVTAAVLLLATKASASPVPADRSNELVKPSRGLRGPQGRVIGGTVVRDPSKWPFITALLQGDWMNYASCGGAMIAPRVMVTAAHCVFGDEPVDRGVVGEQNQDQFDDDSVFSGSKFMLSQVRRHPQYDPTREVNDIAIVGLDAPVDGPFAIVNSDSNVPRNNQALEVAGWGRVPERGVANGDEQPTVELMETGPLFYIPPSRCSRLGGSDLEGGPLTDDTMCAAAPGKDSCSGDSGGPLMLLGENVLVGIVSHGVDCNFDDAGENPATYSRVSHNFDWIREQVCSFSRNDAPSYFNCGGDAPDTTATPNADPDPSCDDGNGSCEAWAAAGECERNPAFMVTNCARSCNECDTENPTEEATPAPTPESTADLTEESTEESTAEPESTPDPSCEDGFGNCEAWAAAGECERNPAFMVTNCARSCNECDTENPTEEATPAPTPESTADLTEESTEESTAEPESTPPKEIAIDWRFGIGSGGAPVSANVGDTLLFTWGGFHNVYIAPSNSCNNLSSGTDLGASSPVRYTVQTEDEGGIVFACEVPGHCQAGMLLPVNVGQTSSNESAGTTSDPSCEDDNESCEAWADAGECEGNPDYMLTNCASSCDACGGRRS